MMMMTMMMLMMVMMTNLADCTSVQRNRFRSRIGMVIVTVTDNSRVTGHASSDMSNPPYAPMHHTLQSTA